MTTVQAEKIARWKLSLLQLVQGRGVPRAKRLPTLREKLSIVPRKPDILEGLVEQSG